MKQYVKPELEIYRLIVDVSVAAVIKSEPTVKDIDDDLSV